MTQTTAAPSLPDLTQGVAALRPKILVGASRRALAPAAAEAVVGVVCDLHRFLPDMFEVTFRDDTGGILGDTGIELGTKLVIEAGSPGTSSLHRIVAGEVTALEGSYGPHHSVTTVRGYSLDHRLQRARHTRTFVDATDSSVARDLASAAGLAIGEVRATSVVHPVLAQDDQTDWQFLRSRALEIGYELGVADDKFYFRPTGGSGGSAIAVRAGRELLSFAPRVSAANLAGPVEVRGWDPVQAKAVAATSPLSAPGVRIGAGTPGRASDLFAPRGGPAAAGSSDLGPPPKPQGFAVQARSGPGPGGSDAGLRAAATALGEQLSSGFAEADGELVGDARIGAGTALDVTGVPRPFAGTWRVTRVRHVFADRGTPAYRTTFQVSGAADRSLLALAGGGATRQPGRIDGLACGIVTQIDDPLGLGRVKVALPWLAPDHVGDWAPVVQLAASKNGGAMFLPGPGDQVLVGFELGNLRRPYVLGSVPNRRTGSGGALGPGGSGPGASAVKAGHPASVTRRGLVTGTGHRLVFVDEGPPGGGRPTASQIHLTTGGDSIGLVLDQVKGELTLSCTPGSPPGQLRITCDGTVEIKAGASGQLTIDGGQRLTLKGQTVAVEGKTVSLEGTGPVTVKGNPIQLN